MPYSLPLPEKWADRGWKVKIQEMEHGEEPHITVIRKDFKWQWGLRSGAFLKSEPDPREIPEELLQVVQENRETLRQRWDEKYPENPVASREDGDE